MGVGRRGRRGGSDGEVNKPRADSNSPSLILTLRRAVRIAQHSSRSHLRNAANRRRLGSLFPSFPLSFLPSFLFPSFNERSSLPLSFYSYLLLSLPRPALIELASSRISPLLSVPRCQVRPHQTQPTGHPQIIFSQWWNSFGRATTLRPIPFLSRPSMPHSLCPPCSPFLRSLVPASLASLPRSVWTSVSLVFQGEYTPGRKIL